MGLRDLIFRFVSEDTARKMEEDSKLWVMQCRHCGKETSIWEMGGIRYKAAGNPRRLWRCRTCNRISWHPITKRPA